MCLEILIILSGFSDDFKRDTRGSEVGVGDRGGWAGIWGENKDRNISLKPKVGK